MASNGNRAHAAETDPLEALRADLAALRKDFTAMNHEHGFSLGRLGHSAHEMFNGVTSNVKDLAGKAKAGADIAHRQVTGMAKSRPLTTIAVALAVGMIGGHLLGKFTRR